MTAFVYNSEIVRSKGGTIGEETVDEVEVLERAGEARRGKGGTEGRGLSGRSDMVPMKCF